jgi:hypothetical protein
LLVNALYKVILVATFIFSSLYSNIAVSTLFFNYIACFII